MRTQGASLPSILLHIAIRVGFAPIFGLGCDSAQPALAGEAQTASAVTVTVEVAQAGTFERTIAGYGTVKPAAEIRLSVEQSAKVREVLVDVGDAVTLGQVLIRLEQGRHGLKLRRAGSSVSVAKAELEEAERSFGRKQQLREQGAVAVAEVDQAEALLKQARARHSSALAAKRLVQRDLQDGIIRSPVAGRVQSRDADSGEVVVPGQPLLVVEDFSTVEITTWVSERDINGIEVGSQAAVVAPGTSERTFDAVVTGLGSRAHGRTGNFEVVLTVLKPAATLRTGMTVDVELKARDVGQVFTVPQAAVVDRDRKHVIFVVEQGRARQITPVLLASTQDRIPVLEGLVAGAQVVVGGVTHLRDGTEVRVRDEVAQ